jgi:hypothetical protein
VAGERAGVRAGELAGIERGGEDLPLRDAQLDAASDQARVERIVVAVDAYVRVGCDPGDKAAVDVGQLIGQRPHELQLLGQALGRAAAERAVEAQVAPLVSR